jgi:hypothetical protein
MPRSGREGSGATMKDMNREATLREVLSEVSLLDAGSLFNKYLAQFGCLGVFFAGGLLLEGVWGTSDFGVPSWAYWLFFIWVALAIYTNDKSYHDHQFKWYFPRAGWLGSIPLAVYLLLGIELLRSMDPKAELGVRAALLGLWLLWLLVLALGVGILEVGHNRLMEKRAAGRDAEQTATN